MRDSKGCFFLRALVFLLIFAFLVSALGFALSPAESFTRQMLHDLYAGEIEIETAFVGASHALYGFDTRVIDRELATHSFNLGSASQKPMDSYFLLRELYRANKPDLIVIEITYAMYTKYSGYDNPLSSMILFDHFALGKNKLDYLKAAFRSGDYPELFLKAYRYRNRLGSAPANLKKKLTKGWLACDPSSISGEDVQYQARGFVSSKGGFQQGGMGRVTPYKWDESNLDPKGFDFLEAMIRLCRDAGSEIILVSAPLPVATLLTLGNYQEVHAYFTDFARGQGVPYLDFNLVKEAAYSRPDTNYFDSNHLNGEGAASFSRVLCQVLKDHASGEDISSSFYPDFQDLKYNYPRVSNVYLQLKEADKQISLTARSYQGDLVYPEYRFLIKGEEDESFVPLTDFSPDARLILEHSHAAGSWIRVEARAKGSDDDPSHDVIQLP